MQGILEFFGRFGHDGIHNLIGYYISALVIPGNSKVFFYFFFIFFILLYTK